MEKRTEEILRILRNLWAVSRNWPFSSMLYWKQKPHTWYMTVWNSGKRCTAYCKTKGCECTVRNGVGCNNCCIYRAVSVQWGTGWVQQLLYIHSWECTVRNGVGCNSCCIYSAVSVQWGMEWGATVAVFTFLWEYSEEWSGVQKLLYLHSCECSVRNGVGCNSCCIYSAVGVDWGMKCGATAAVFTVLWV